MITLLIDVVSNNSIIALISEEKPKTFEKINLDSNQLHSESIVPALELLISKSTFNYLDIKKVICVTGPGNYTNIRTGLAVAKSISLVNNIDTYGITQHELIAESYQYSPISNAFIVITHSTNNNFYYKEFNQNMPDQIDPILLHADEVLNKIDKVDQQILENISSKWKTEFNNAEIWTTSALNKFNVENLKERIIELLPEGPKYFPDDQWTDKSERFFVNEIIREKIFNYYKEEIPYSSEVVTEKFKYRNKVFRISSSIIVERNSQKAIIIGNKGSSLKKVASQSRTDLEKFFNQKVFLEINVKVVKDWRKKSQQLKNFGYN